MNERERNGERRGSYQRQPGDGRRYEGSRSGGAPGARRPVPPYGNQPRSGAQGASRQGGLHRSEGRGQPRAGDLPRPGIRTIEDPRAKQKKHQFALVLSLLALIGIVVIAVLISSLKIKLAPPSNNDTPPQASDSQENIQGGTDSLPAAAEPDTDPEPESVYASRVSDTVQLGDEIVCKNAVLIDVSSNIIIAEKGGDDKIFPASMTKVMTALVAAENCESLDEKAVVSSEVIAPLAAANASVAGLAPGDEVTMRDLIYGSLLPSGADATGTIAEHIAGSEAEFAVLMNKKCEELGIKNTHFVNASGLHDDNHYSTCHDIAVIMQAAMKNDFLKEVLGTYEHVIAPTKSQPDGITVYSTVFSRVEGSEEFEGKIKIVGGKTGYTGEAGQCLVSAAMVNGSDKLYVFVCAGGENRWKPVFDTIHVYRTYLGVKYDGEYVPKSQR